MATATKKKAAARAKSPPPPRRTSSAADPGDLTHAVASAGASNNLLDAMLAAVAGPPDASTVAPPTGGVDGRARGGERPVDAAGDASDVARLCDTYGLRREDLGRLTGFSLRALADWSTGKLPSEPAKRRLHEIRRLLDALAEVVKVEAIPTWLKTRNPAFENMTPIQVIEVGEIDRLWQMVHHMGSDSVG
jgi:hypothetical protein